VGGSGSTVASVPGLPSDAFLRQQIQFCKTSDGVHLALSATGSGPTLVKTASWLNHLEFDWPSPVWSPLFTRLAARNRLVRYDERGTGLSDRDTPNFSFEAFLTIWNPSSRPLHCFASLCSAFRRARPLPSPMRFDWSALG
jgi:pimeloyl-ACP methyl ester carboxylesterase